VPGGRWPDALVRIGQVGWLGLASPRKPAGHGEDLGGATGDKTGKQGSRAVRLAASTKLRAFVSRASTSQLHRQRMAIASAAPR
jgi:hypothetical protein